MKQNAVIIGNSDGIGLAVTRELLRRGWSVTGISRSDSLIRQADYRHHVADVTDPAYSDLVRNLSESSRIDLCIYCTGIGELLNLENMRDELVIFQVNLIGMVQTVSRVLPAMVKRGKGQFIGISSVADELLSADAPSYHASKAGFSSYLEGLALALKKTGVSVSNIRFGFVDTKMAKGERRPFMMSVDRAAAHVLRCIEKKPARLTAPLFITPLVTLRRWMLRRMLGR